MLSKSQAKMFFIVGTVLCAGSFLLLTIDTIKRIPAQTKSENLTPEAIRGKHLFDSNNCMGCHTIMGEGAYYAPELTKVYERRGASFIKQMLIDPEGMYPGQRKMVKYNFSEEEISSLIAFLKWIGEMDLNGFPAKTELMKLASPNPTESSSETKLVETKNRPTVFNQMCIACHSLNGQGGTIGPALDNIGTTRDSTFISQWLRDPMAIKPDSKMPKLPLSEEDIIELTAYLSQLKGANE